jgi:regulator of Ty1 transposition protein 103
LTFKICGPLKHNSFCLDKDPKRKTLAKELEDNENLLKRSIEKLKSAKASRAALVSQLKEALQEQVSDRLITFTCYLNVNY